jgi:hypothetical protein
MALICVAVAQLTWLPASHADNISTATLVYREIKFTGNSGRVFALGFMPSEAGKLYWSVDQGGVAHLYTYDIGSSTVTGLTQVIPSSFLPSSFTWSPDGRQVALIRGLVLKLVGINVHTTQNLFLGVGQWGPMFWTPNHSILTACAPDARVAHKLCAIDTSTGFVTALVAPGEGSLYAMGYIEGANKLIYERWNPGEAPNPVHLYSASIFSDHVGNLIPLSYPDIRGEGYLSVTPDGSYGVTIGQLMQAKGKDPDIYLGDFSTGNWMRVPSPAGWGTPAMAVLSPDHRHLVVTTADGKGGYRMWLADVPGRLLDPGSAPH